MKNIFILYMPTGNAEAMVHYQDTIKNKVSQDRIFKHVGSDLRDRLRNIFGNNPIATWGSRSGENNRSRFSKMQPGDERTRPLTNPITFPVFSNFSHRSHSKF